MHGRAVESSDARLDLRGPTEGCGDLCRRDAVIGPASDRVHCCVPELAGFGEGHGLAELAGVYA